MKNLEGKMIIKVDETTNPKQRASEQVMELSDKLINLEQYLNEKVATEVYKRWKIGVRFHILEGRKT